MTHAGKPWCWTHITDYNEGSFTDPAPNPSPAPSTHTVKLRARYYQTAPTITPGQVKTAMLFHVVYQ